MTNATGIDVSNWQGAVDWSKTGVEFAGVKITEGTTFVDAGGKANLVGMKQNNIFSIGYHFARPAASGAKVQADFFLQHINGSELDALALDLEDAGGLNFSELQTWVDEFFTELKAKSKDKIYLLYMDLNYASKISVPQDVHLWIATRGQAVPSDMKFLIHQTGQGTNPGVQGNVDIDVASVSRETLDKMVAPAQSSQDPAPATQTHIVDYTVQSGDTLSEIAKVHNVELKALEAANPQITNPDKIDVGETVHIPEGKANAQTPTGKETYVTVSNEVLKGDKVPNNSLWNISLNETGDGSKWHYLSELNPGVMPRQLQLGEKIRVK